MRLGVEGDGRGRAAALKTGAAGVRVWLFDNSRPVQGTEFAFLAKDETAYVNRLANAADRTAYIVTRTALRLNLGEILGIPPADIHFRRNSWGKLALAEPGTDRVDFSVTHTKGLSAIAISDGRPVGIDLERQRDLPDRARIAADVFGEDVARQLLALPSGKQCVLFLQLWTAAEAFVKAQGLGFAGLGGKVPIYLSTGESPQVRFREGISAEWTLDPLLPPSGFVGTVAAGRSPQAVGGPRRIWDAPIRPVVGD